MPGERRQRDEEEEEEVVEEEEEEEEGEGAKTEGAMEGAGAASRAGSLEGKVSKGSEPASEEKTNEA